MKRREKNTFSCFGYKNETNKKYRQKIGGILRKLGTEGVYKIHSFLNTKNNLV